MGDWEKAFGGIRKIVEGVMGAIKGLTGTVLSTTSGIVKTVLTMIGAEQRVHGCAGRQQAGAGGGFSHFDHEAGSAGSDCGSRGIDGGSGEMNLL